MPRSSFSFEPQYRLHFPWEYRKFFQGSEVLRLPECVIFRIGNTLGHFRVGITVKAKCNSVERNRVKRAIREAFRVSRERLGSFDYNVVVSGSRTLDFAYARGLRRALLKEFMLDREIPRFKRARSSV